MRKLIFLQENLHEVFRFFIKLKVKYETFDIKYSCVI
jgi:hypothetical protein